MKINDERCFAVNIYAPNKDSESAKFLDHLINVFKKGDRTFEHKNIAGGACFELSFESSDGRKCGIMITKQRIVDRLESLAGEPS